MYNTRLVNQVVDWERRIQIENERQGKPHSDKYALLPPAAAAHHKESKPQSQGILATLKVVPFLSIFLG